MVRISVIGDYQPTNETHVATTSALQHAGFSQGAPTEVTWVPTERVEVSGVEVLAGADGLLVAPGSPYASLTGALDAITHARVHDVPLLGTCGGFQHVVLEFARNVAGFHDAQHAEYDPYASTLFITPLSCSLVGKSMTVRVKDNTRASSAYKKPVVTERYYCNFGLNPAHVDTIVRNGLVVSGTDQEGEPRIVELPGRRFFVATLFVPQTSSAPGSPHPLLVALVEAAVTAARAVEA